MWISFWIQFIMKYDCNRFDRSACTLYIHPPIRRTTALHSGGDMRKIYGLKIEWTMQMFFWCCFVCLNFHCNFQCVLSISVMIVFSIWFTSSSCAHQFRSVCVCVHETKGAKNGVRRAKNAKSNYKIIWKTNTAEWKPTDLSGKHWTE